MSVAVPPSVTAAAQLPARTVVHESEVITCKAGTGWLTSVIGGPLDGEEYYSLGTVEAVEAHAGAVWMVRARNGYR